MENKKNEYHSLQRVDLPGEVKELIRPFMDELNGSERAIDALTLKMGRLQRELFNIIHDWDPELKKYIFTINNAKKYLRIQREKEDWELVDALVEEANDLKDQLESHNCPTGEENDE